VPVLPVDAEHIKHHGGAHTGEDGRCTLLVLQVLQFFQNVTRFAENVVWCAGSGTECLACPFDTVLEHLPFRVTIGRTQDLHKYKSTVADGPSEVIGARCEVHIIAQLDDFARILLGGVKYLEKIFGEHHIIQEAK